MWNGDEASLELATRYEVPNSYENVRKARGMGNPSLGWCAGWSAAAVCKITSTAVYSTPSTGTRTVSGLIRAKSWAARGQNSSYGYPISDQVCGLKEGGCLQVFEHGSIRR